MVLAVPLPQISVSLAPPDEPFVEPFSPFSSTNAIFHDDDDSFRPKHLTPPPAHIKFNTLVPSPLRPSENTGKGLERERFEALLKSSRERNSSGLKKGNDLRKEIALKVHKNKQAERRALFLSKVLAPPSPSATSLPKTPPESPAIFHYTLPSPGLVSPLALFESLNDASSGPLTYAREPWVEQVDFRLPAQPKPGNVASSTPRSTSEAKSSRRFPSLDQITARLGHGHSRTPSAESDGKRSLRLPSFLIQPGKPEAERPRLSLGVGRLQTPVQSPKPSKQEHATILPPKSPRSPLMPQIQITTTVVPRSSSSSPTKLSESNVNALNMRERKAANMLSTLKRRMAPSEAGINDHEHQDPDERRWRRHSAPAEMVARPRAGFEHPVLKLPGGF
ncbi:hypothetical protein Moror_146 [Moniliophthora roreri MCA 2997]|uniref:Uncharacterized protein n=2 Tax=Moniliophthora roreri TaxID=221103 RepID=V2XZW2_MONRO|nr:hypothetical protein Moror_146 [Moniliophthora roreri MCA 2997]KAI3622811.1 hypothetical protein WG66_015490 [Moniliophthora roreri]